MRVADTYRTVGVSSREIKRMKNIYPATPSTGYGMRLGPFPSFQKDGLPIPPDLSAIASAWQNIPGEIRAAIKAIVTPYLPGKPTNEGGE